MKKENKGITLIALIVTIIVMLILVTVTVSTVIGNGGIFTKAQQGKIQQTHAQIKESFVIEQGSYMAEKTKNADLDFITYLRNKDIIDENNVINVEKLVGQKLSAGNGTFEKHKDIYVIESETTSVAQATQVASLETVQIAKASTVINYNIVYYDKNGKKETIGTVVDLINKQEETKKTIKFSVKADREDSGYGSYTFETLEGTTWVEFCDKNDSFRCVESTVLFDGMPLHNVSPNDIIEDGNVYYFPGAECVRENTEIIVAASGKIKLAKDILVGDTIVYYNFETNQLEEGTVSNVYIHRNATNFVKYTFEDGSYLEATDYHPIYTEEGWKSLTQRNAYEKPEIGDKVKTEKGWKTLISIEEYTGLEDCYDFGIESKDGNSVDNYFANGTLVQNSIK